MLQIWKNMKNTWKNMKQMWPVQQISLPLPLIMFCHAWAQTCQELFHLAWRCWDHVRSSHEKLKSSVDYKPICFIMLMLFNNDIGNDITIQWSITFNVIQTWWTKSHQQWSPNYRNPTSKSPHNMPESCSHLLSILATDSSDSSRLVFWDGDIAASALAKPSSRSTWIAL